MAERESVYISKDVGWAFIANSSAWLEQWNTAASWLQNGSTDPYLYIIRSFAIGLEFKKSAICLIFRFLLLLLLLGGKWWSHQKKVWPMVARVGKRDVAFRFLCVLSGDSSCFNGFDDIYMPSRVFKKLCSRLPANIASSSIDKSWQEKRTGCK